MAALEVVSGYVTAPSATRTAITLSNGSLTVRNFSKGNAWLVSSWKNGQASVGDYRIRSPRLHDFTNGLLYRVPFGSTQPDATMGFPQRLIAQDTLSVDVVGSAVAGDIENVCLLIYYEFLDGANGVYIDLTELERRMVNLVVPSYSTTGGTTGVWSAGVALSGAALGDILKANTQYAILGFAATESAVNNAASVAVSGVDTGNLFVGCPVSSSEPFLMANWFVELTKKHGRPMLPTINSANKGGTFVYSLNNENANTIIACPIMAELR